LINYFIAFLEKFKDPKEIILKGSIPSALMEEKKSFEASTVGSYIKFILDDLMSSDKLKITEEDEALLLIALLLSRELKNWTGIKICGDFCWTKGTADSGCSSMITVLGGLILWNEAVAVRSY
jgi:hypothetical protein